MHQKMKENALWIHQFVCVDFENMINALQIH